MVRLNITLPDDLGKELKKVSNRSRFISQVLREKLEREKRQRLDELLIEGYQHIGEEDKILDKEWSKATLKDWR